MKTWGVKRIGISLKAIQQYKNFPLTEGDVSEYAQYRELSE